jgi:hypothetical protein
MADGVNASGKAGWARALLVVLLAVGLLQFAYRGPWRALSGYRGPGTAPDHPGVRWDGGLVYSMSRAWLMGENPYEPEGVIWAWLQGGGSGDESPLRDRPGCLLYPPTTLAALSPLARLPWAPVEWIWTGLNVALYAGSLWAVARLGRLRGNWLLLFLTLGVWLAPAATCVKVGQTAIVALGCMAIPAWMIQARGGRGLLAGVMMGLGTAVKPQFGLPFIVYQAGRMRWIAAATAVVMVVALAVGGVARLQASGGQWYESWQRNVHNFPLKEDGNPTMENRAMRHHLLNLHYPLHSFTDDRALVNAMVPVMVAVPCVAYLAIDLRDQKRRRRLWTPGGVEGGGELLSLAMTSAAMLLVVYHRFYDGVAMVFPIGLAAAGLMRGERRHWVTLALCLPFLAPGPVMLVDAAAKGWVPAALSQSWAWERLIVPQQAWAVLALLLWCVWLRWKAAKRPEASEGAAAPA